jgi:hypothetical protein
MLAYTVIDQSSVSEPRAVLYARQYHPLTGWEAGSTVLEATSLVSSQLYRPHNDIRLASDGSGNAVLVATAVLAGSGNALKSGRKYGVKAFQYSDALGWSGGTEILGTPSCGATQAACNSLRATGAVFGPREALVVFDGPEAVAPAAFKLRLYGAEFR